MSRIFLLLALALAALAALLWLAGVDPESSPAPVERSDAPASASPPRLEGAPGARTPEDGPAVGPAARRRAAAAATLAVAGTVRRADGEPVGHGWVDVTSIPRDRTGPGAVREERIEVDDEGRFRLEGLLPGRVRLVALPGLRSDGKRVSAVTDAGDEHVELVLEPVARTCGVNLSVVDIVSGHAPVDTCLAIYVAADGEEHLFRCYCWEPQATPPPGRYLGEYRAAPGSTCTFRAVAVGYEQTRPLTVAVPDNVDELRVTLELTPASDRVGLLTLHLAAGGAGMPEIVEASWSHPEIAVEGIETLVEHDRFALRLPSGRVTIMVETPWSRANEGFPAGILVGDLVVDVRGGERREVEVPFPVAGFVFLVGDPDAWRPEFVLTRPGSAVHRVARAGTWKDEDGFLIGPLASGRWTIAYDGTEARYAGEVDVLAENVTRVHRDDLEATPLPPKDR